MGSPENRIGQSNQKFNTQKEAIREARKIAKNQGNGLNIHGLDGRIRDQDSYV